MKKLIAICLVFVMGVLTLASCEMATPAVQNVTVNADGSYLITYEDGTTQTVKGEKSTSQSTSSSTSSSSSPSANGEYSFDQDGNLVITYPSGKTVTLGKDALKQYTVRFFDYNGTLLLEETVFAGLGAKGPADPKREDYIFAGWDQDISSVKKDMVVTATYTAMEAFTVTFVDYDGKELAKETVVSGKGATAPADPVRPDYNFAGWDKDFSSVTEDMTITATYTEKGSYVVTFMDYNGLPLGSATVQEGATATAPVTPTRDGYTFRGWSSSLSNITGNKTVTAQYTLVNAANVFDIAYKVSGNTVTLTLSLAGNVCLAGAQGTLSFEGMTVTAVTANSANVLANKKSDGSISIVYASATNVTKGETIITVTLTKTADAGNANLTFSKVCDQNNLPVDYTVVGQTIRLK